MSARPMGRWYKLLHYVLVLVVFSITGLLSVLVSRYFIHGALNLEGGIWSGPWSYRVAYLLLIPPFYSVTLVVIGTVFGKQAYFKNRIKGTWGRVARLGRVGIRGMRR